MLIQMPRGSGPAQPGETSRECQDFEAGLRRDLASAPVVSYDSAIGGWSKRALDLFLSIFTAPVWAPALALVALWARRTHSAPVFVANERIGYGGRMFHCYNLRLAPPEAVVTPLHPDKERTLEDIAVIADKAEDRRAKWRRALERMPQLFNVIRGDMSLVGPLPLSREQLDPLKTAKRYYLSARPGVMGVAAVGDADAEEAGQYKLYALSWSLTTDALIAWESLMSLKDRGELWRPALLRGKRGQKAAPVVVRRRTGTDAA